LRSRRSTIHGGLCRRDSELREGDFQLIQRIVRASSTARRCEVGPRTTGKELGERRMIVPVAHELRSRSGGAGTASPECSHRPARSDFPPPVPVWRPSSIISRPPGRDSRQPRTERGPFRQLLPIGGGLNIDFDDPGIRPSRENCRWRGSFAARSLSRMMGCASAPPRPHRAYQFEIVLELAWPAA